MFHGVATHGGIACLIADDQCVLLMFEIHEITEDIQLEMSFHASISSNSCGFRTFLVFQTSMQTMASTNFNGCDSQFAVQQPGISNNQPISAQADNQTLHSVSQPVGSFTSLLNYDCPVFHSSVEREPLAGVSSVVQQPTNMVHFYTAGDGAAPHDFVPLTNVTTLASAPHPGLSYQQPTSLQAASQLPHSSFLQTYADQGDGPHMAPDFQTSPQLQQYAVMPQQQTQQGFPQLWQSGEIHSQMPQQQQQTQAPFQQAFPCHAAECGQQYQVVAPVNHDPTTAQTTPGAAVAHVPSQMWPQFSQPVVGPEPTRQSAAQEHDGREEKRVRRRPQPVPQVERDDAYRKRRDRNNEAACKSRAKRRLREENNEKQIEALKNELEKVVKHYQEELEREKREKAELLERLEREEAEKEDLQEKLQEMLRRRDCHLTL